MGISGRSLPPRSKVRNHTDVWPLLIRVVPELPMPLLQETVQGSPQIHPQKPLGPGDAEDENSRTVPEMHTRGNQWAELVLPTSDFLI